ncbi:hypothetical protein E8E13_011066 [Curvularia kusanoi]|uniref:Uncharacterized protein n=1 Tax=Curvularia kusanoi TaxID=90978 RepID=A0A9P4WAP5_CURKU|nr:hypothetical protein E8E13_011066 [Curvularia kusanoi]
MAQRKSTIFAPANYKHLHRDPSGVPTRPRSYQADHTGSGLPNAQDITLATPEESQLGTAQCENNLPQSPGTATTDLAETPRIAHNRQKHMRKATHPSSIPNEATADALDVMAEPGPPSPGVLEASEVFSIVPPISRERFPDISSSSNPGGGQAFPGRSSKGEFSDMFERLRRSTPNSTKQRRPSIDISSDELSGESQPTEEIITKVKKKRKEWKKYAAPRAATSAVTYAEADAPSCSTLKQAARGATAAEEQ